jgi:hypothetical protein
MSGLVGSKLNIRGSGLVGSLGTDGQHLLSSGAGKTNVFETAAGGYWNLIKSITASSSATISFVNGTSDVVFDSTYKQYLVRIIDAHAATDGVDFTFNGSSDTGSAYDVEKMTGVFATFHREGNAAETGATYRDEEDSTLATTFTNIVTSISNDADSATSGDIIFFNPADTTFSKHFYAHFNFMTDNSPHYHKLVTFGGYFNTTSVVDALQFKMSSGNIDAGQFNLYGAT